VELGGGRHRADDPIDPRVGLGQVRPLGTRLTTGEPVAWVHAADAAGAARAVAQVQAACTWGDETDTAWIDAPSVMDTVAHAS
jgi:thymidine phosphorylase